MVKLTFVEQADGRLLPTENLKQEVVSQGYSKEQAERMHSLTQERVRKERQAALSRIATRAAKVSLVIDTKSGAVVREGSDEHATLLNNRF